MVGQNISHYHILSKLGEGGMGVVYKAEDTKLRRTVALKFLPPHASDDQEYKTRFQREAQAAASLNHPNICTIYEIDPEHGFLAMEYVDGPSVKAKIADRPLKLEEGLDIARQAALGLQAAHERGIVHRDIKSANLMLTAKGQVKVMDFGLAQLTDRSRITRTGATTGTPAYMSPEQVKAEPTDRRTDIWSLAVVLYEMVAGRLPFAGEVEQAISFSIVSQEPEHLTALRSGIPIEMDRVMARALAKSPEERYQHLDEFLVDLRRLQREAAPARADTGGPSRGMFWAVAALAVAALTAAGYLMVLRKPEVLPNPLDGARISRLTDFPGSELDAVISPDGKFVAFLSDREGIFDALITQTGSGEYRNLTNGRFSELLHEQMTSLGFTEDGGDVWMRVTGLGGTRGVWLASTLGGDPRPFLSQALAVTWSPDANRIAYFQPDPGDPIFIANRDRSNPRKLSEGSPGDHWHFPTWSPDGKFIYFVGTLPPLDTDIWRVPAAGGKAERLTNHHSRVYSPAFLDARRMLYAATSEDGLASSLYLMDLELNTTRRISFGIEQIVSVSASKDGRRLAACVGNPTSNLWSVPISELPAAEKDAVRVQAQNLRAVAPRFGPGFLVFVSSRGGSDGLWASFADGSAREIWRAEGGKIVGAPAISADGRRLCFGFRKNGRTGLHVINQDGTDLQMLAPKLDVRDAPSWSPDGNWIAVGDASNRIFRVPTNGGEPERLTSDSSRGPVWSPDGTRIIYYQPRASASYRVMSVEPGKAPTTVFNLFVRGERDHFRFLPGGKGLVILQGEFRRQDFHLLDFATGKLRRLTNLKPGYRIDSFDVSPDGKRIVFDRTIENSDVVLIELAQ